MVKLSVLYSPYCPISEGTMEDYIVGGVFNEDAMVPSTPLIICLGEKLIDEEVNTSLPRVEDKSRKNEVSIL